MYQEERERIAKIAIPVLGADFFEGASGVTGKAKRIYDILKEGYDVTLIARASKNEKRKHEDIIVVRPAKTKLWNLKLIPIIQKNKFDYVYCLDPLTFINFYVFSPIRKYKIIFDVRGIIKAGSPFGKLSGKIYQFLTNFAAKHADYVIAEVEYVFEYYKKFNQNISFIPLFVDENIFKRCEEANESRPNGIKIIGLLGPFDIQVNRIYLDFLYANLSKFDDRIHFVVIGKCNNRIENERITYTGFLNSMQDYIDQLSSLDAVLLIDKPLNPGPYTKILESMACSLPVFTTPKGRLGIEYTEPGKDILVFEKDELPEKVNELIFDENLMTEIGKNARITIEKYYNKSVNEKKLIEILGSLLT
jgi:glycosyltransferase involved in cell wall biosynthesis